MKTNGSGRKKRPILDQASLFAANAQLGTSRAIYHESNRVTLFEGDCIEFLGQLPSGCAQLVVTSPPYNIGKEYEKRASLASYVAQQTSVIDECVRIVGPSGSICWQVGNYVEKGAIVPLDVVLMPVFLNAGLKLRNRIVWHFEHGLHCSRRFSGRYEVVMWFTKSDQYTFDLDPVRIAQKYPGKKYFKGPRAGEFSCNPLGKNPGDLWIIPNVKHNHVEKTDHPCQFPVELVERLVLSMTSPNDLVVDPFIGAGTTAVAAIRHSRRAAGSEILPRYVEIARNRLALEADGQLKTRPMNRAVYRPSPTDRAAKRPWDGTAQFQIVEGALR